MRIELNPVPKNEAQPAREKQPKAKNKDAFDKMIAGNQEPSAEEKPVRKRITISKQEQEQITALLKKNENQADIKFDKKPVVATKTETGTKEELVQLVKELTGEKKTKKAETTEAILEPGRKRMDSKEILSELPKKAIDTTKTKETSENPLLEEILETKKDTKTLKQETIADKIVNTKPEPIKKEEKMELLLNKIKGNNEIPNTIKEKLIAMIEQKTTPEKVIKELKTEMQRVENQVMPLEFTGLNKMEAKMEIKEWVDRIKVELKHMMDFRVESENRVRISLNNGDGYVRMNIEKINNQIIITSDTSNNLRKTIDDILTEVKVEMRDRNIEVKLEKDKEREKEQQQNQEEANRERRREKNGSNNPDEQRRRGE